MKLDKTFDGLFHSMGEALVVCTLIVSIGKALTSSYFCFLIGSFALLILILGISEYSKYMVKRKLAVLGSISSKRKAERKTVVFANDSAVEKRASLPEDGEVIANLPILRSYLSKKRKSYPTETIHKEELLCKSTSKDGSPFRAVRRLMSSKGVQRFQSFKKRSNDEIST